MSLRTILLVVMLAAASGALAQEVVNSPDFHARHNAGSTYYEGNQDQLQQQQPLPPQPTGYWEKTWGAIAPSPVGGVLGTALGARSKGEAERLALADCKAKGGGACEVRLAYHNQCAVMVLGNNIYRTASAGSINEATEVGIEACSKEDTGCRVYYSACTEPIFHKY